MIGLKNFAVRLTKNLRWVFFVIFLILAVFEITEINNSVQVALQAGKEPVAASKEKGVRINFDDYNRIVQRIQEAQYFQPTGGIAADPFTSSATPVSVKQ